MKLFRPWFLPDKVNLHSISLETFDWPVHEEKKYEIMWRSTAFPAQLSLHFFPRVPDLPAHPSLVDRLIPFYQKKLKKAEGAIIEVSELSIQGIAIIRTIFKIPMKAGGYIYIGSLTIPFANYSYVIKIQAQEYQKIGSREMTVKKKWKKPDFHAEQTWECPPYPNLMHEPHAMNESEKVTHDLFFPHHPLSKVRQHLLLLEKSLTFSPEILKLSPYRKGLK